MKICKDIGETFISDPEVCDRIIDFFESMPSADKRITGTAKSIASNKPDEHHIKVMKGRRVLDTSIHPYKCVDDEELKMFVPLLQEIKENVKFYESKVNVDGINVDYIEGFNIQKYTPPHDVYAALHSEWSEHNRIYSRRTYVYCLYLNTINEGGETFFIKQNVKVKPEKGKLVIFPAYWTHLHKGIKTKETKYILTGWLSAVLQGETIDELLQADAFYDVMRKPKSFFDVGGHLPPIL
tara:strand:+ start:164 stop:880 length:717 start_codon:yes stop_codon:yes gene_type:complete